MLQHNFPRASPPQRAKNGLAGDPGRTWARLVRALRRWTAGL